MSITSSIVAVVGAVVSKKKEDPLMPFKRSYELANEQERKAIAELQCATNDLACIIKEQMKDK